VRADKTALDCLGMSLAELRLSVRVRHCLAFYGITTVRDLVIRPVEEQLESQALETTLKEVKRKLGEIGLRLGMRISDGLLTFGDELP